MNILEARLMYIVSKLDSIEKKLDRLDGTVTGLSIKVYEDKANGTEGLLGCGTTKSNGNGRTRKARTSKKDV